MCELDLGPDLVRALLADQHPDLAHLELRDVDGGWGNRMWRLGDELAVRLPRRRSSSASLGIEQTWLPGLAAGLPLPTPVPVRNGRPSSRFEHPWTVARWVVGEPADRAPITRAGSAEVLAGFLRALHEPAPAAAPHGPERSDPLARVRGSRFERVDEYPGAREVMECAVAVTAWRGPRVWLHADLHPANVVTSGGALAGVVDFGDMCAGDPATDLSAAWLLLPAGTVARFLDAYGAVDDATVARARGWALLRALGLIDIGRDGRLGRAGGKPTWEPAGYAALERVLAPF